jgi:succinylarginine dihydrolase
MALILPEEARENAQVWGWLQAMIAGNGPIRRLEVVDVRQSMANGGGPACLRLRVVADPAKVDPRFLVDEARLDLISAVIEQHWPEAIVPAAIADPALIGAIERARRALLEALDIVELIDN